MNGTLSTLDYGERWLADGLRVCERAGGFAVVEVDMSNSVALRKAFRRQGTCVTYTHIFVRATALVLSRHPELHQARSPSKKWQPEDVNIGLSVAGRTFLAPLLLIKNAARKGIAEIADAVRVGADDARKEQEDLLAKSNRWGWLVPFGFLRQAIIRRLIQKVIFGSEAAPTFQVSCLPGVKQVAPLLLGATAVLAAGGVEKRILVIEGKPEVRFAVSLTCCFDHKVWDGAKLATFLSAIKELLESDELSEELKKTKPNSSEAKHPKIKNVLTKQASQLMT